jgi:hypothetical protein
MRFCNVTESQDSEVVAARALMEEILADKPVPDVSQDAPIQRKKRAGKKLGNQKGQKSGRNSARLRANE